MSWASRGRAPTSERLCSCLSCRSNGARTSLGRSQSEEDRVKSSCGQGLQGIAQWHIGTAYVGHSLSPCLLLSGGRLTAGPEPHLKKHLLGVCILCLTYSYEHLDAACLRMDCEVLELLWHRHRAEVASTSRMRSTQSLGCDILKWLPQVCAGLLLDTPCMSCYKHPTSLGSGSLLRAASLPPRLSTATSIIRTDSCNPSRTCSIHRLHFEGRASLLADNMPTWAFTLGYSVGVSLGGLKRWGPPRKAGASLA